MTCANIPMTDGVVRPMTDGTVRLMADGGARLTTDGGTGVPTTGAARRRTLAAAWLATLFLCGSAVAQEIDLSDLASLEFHNTQGEWTRFRLEVEGERARLYLHGNEQPTLLVNDLKLAGQGGAIALWIGPGTVAHFRNLSIVPE